jgi:hypothetical protein
MKNLVYIISFMNIIKKNAENKGEVNKYKGGYLWHLQKRNYY